MADATSTNPPKPPFAAPSTRTESYGSSYNSRTRLGKRALHHPRAVSEVSFSGSSRDGHTGDASHEKAEVGDTYPRGWKLVSITLALCLAVFVTTLDQTIVATATPEITNEFDSLSDVSWYGSAYLLTMASFQLPFGKIYSIFSVKWTFVAAILLFEAGSLICGLAPSSAVLIAGRAVAGLGSAGILSGTLIIVAHTIALQYRPMYAAAVGALSGIAVIIGPLVGGALTDSSASWRWCFYLNLPIGAITLLVVLFLTGNMMPSAPSGGDASKAIIGFSGPVTMGAQLAQFDFIGIFLAIPCVICCLLGLQWGGTTYAWGSVRIVALFMLSFFLLCFFVAWQMHKGDSAMLPPRIMRRRSVAGAAWFSLSLGACFFVVVYYLPIWFQAVQGTSAIGSGIKNLALVLAVVVLSVAAGAFVTWSGYYTPMMILSAIISAVGCGLLTTLRAGSGPGQWIGFQAVLGAGLGLGMQQPLIAVQAVLELGDVATGTAVVIFAQTMGGSIILLAAESLFNNRLVANIAAYAPSVDLDLVASVGATGLRDLDLPEGVRAAVLRACSDAITTTLYIPTAMAAVAIVGALATEWTSVRGKKLGLVV